jgi:hypothetical protein
MAPSPHLTLKVRSLQDNQGVELAKREAPFGRILIFALMAHVRQKLESSNLCISQILVSQDLASAKFGDGQPLAHKLILLWRDLLHSVRDTWTPVLGVTHITFASYLCSSQISPF